MFFSKRKSILKPLSWIFWSHWMNLLLLPVLAIIYPRNSCIDRSTFGRPVWFCTFYYAGFLRSSAAQTTRRSCSTIFWTANTVSQHRTGTMYPIAPKISYPICCNRIQIYDSPPKTCWIIRGWKISDIFERVLPTASVNHILFSFPHFVFYNLVWKRNNLPANIIHSYWTEIFGMFFVYVLSSEFYNYFFFLLFVSILQWFFSSLISEKVEIGIVLVNLIVIFLLNVFEKLSSYVMKT